MSVREAPTVFFTFTPMVGYYFVKIKPAFNDPLTSLIPTVSSSEKKKKQFKIFNFGTAQFLWPHASL